MKKRIKINFPVAKEHVEIAARLLELGVDGSEVHMNDNKPWLLCHSPSFITSDCTPAPEFLDIRTIPSEFLEDIEEGSLSLFQEWNKYCFSLTLKDDSPKRTLIKGRREGWNGALDTIVRIIGERTDIASFGHHWSFLKTIILAAQEK